MDLIRIGLLIAALALGGCAEALTTAMSDARDLHAAGRGFVVENHEWRREIRRRCRELVIGQAEELEQAGDIEGAKRILAEAYPQLVTASTVKQLMNDPENFSARSSGCEPANGD